MFSSAQRKHRRVGSWAVFSQPLRIAFNIAATPMSSRKIYTVPFPISPRCLLPDIVNQVAFPRALGAFRCMERGLHPLLGQNHGDACISLFFLDRSYHE